MFIIGFSMRHKRYDLDSRSLFEQGNEKYIKIKYLNYHGKIPLQFQLPKEDKKTT